MQNETKEFELDYYIDYHFKATHESETSESVHWICSIHWIIILNEVKHLSWSWSISIHSIIREKRACQYYYDQSHCVSNSSQE